MGVTFVARIDGVEPNKGKNLASQYVHSLLTNGASCIRLQNGCSPLPATLVQSVIFSPPQLTNKIALPTYLPVHCRLHLQIAATTEESRSLPALTVLQKLPSPSMWLPEALMYTFKGRHRPSWLGRPSISLQWCCSYRCLRQLLRLRLVRFHCSVLPAQIPACALRFRFLFSALVSITAGALCCP